MRAFLFALGFAACALSLAPGARGADMGRPHSIQMEEAWARRAPMMPVMGQMHAGTGNGAVYVTLRNTAPETDTLVSASSDVAESVEIHETIRDGDVMRMRPVAKLEIPAGGTLTMKPGGQHIMLINLKRELRPGDAVRLMLTFERAAPVLLDAPVR